LKSAGAAACRAFEDAGAQRTLVCGCWDFNAHSDKKPLIWLFQRKRLSGFVGTADGTSRGLVVVEKAVVGQ
jgi:hypothetical protein